MAIETRDAFAARIGQCFVTESGQHALELVSVERHPAAGRLAHEAFTLIFRGPPGAVLPEGHHRFDVAGGHVLAFYIMPIYTPARDRQDYQAVFN